jgi:hypothetical protein
VSDDRVSEIENDQNDLDHFDHRQNNRRKIWIFACLILSLQPEIKRYQNQK